jgi:CheY-like chemotaxis protein
MTKILIIEDEQSLREAYGMILRARGYDVAVAENGFEGLKQLKLHKPQLVLLDMLMPKMNGLEFMRQAEIHKNYPDTRVILFSNFSNSEHLEETQRIGVDRNLLKADITPNRLLEIVSEMVG